MLLLPVCVFSTKPFLFMEDLHIEYFHLYLSTICTEFVILKLSATELVHQVIILLSLSVAAHAVCCKCFH